MRRGRTVLGVGVLLVGVLWAAEAIPVRWAYERPAEVVGKRVRWRGRVREVLSARPPFRVLMVTEGREWVAVVGAERLPVGVVRGGRVEFEGMILPAEVVTVGGTVRSLPRLLVEAGGRR